MLNRPKNYQWTSDGIKKNNNPWEARLYFIEYSIGRFWSKVPNSDNLKAKKYQDQLIYLMI